jgi:hypothetical protein
MVIEGVLQDAQCRVITSDREVPLALSLEYEGATKHDAFNAPSPDILTMVREITISIQPGSSTAAR